MQLSNRKYINLAVKEHLIKYFDVKISYCKYEEIKCFEFFKILSRVTEIKKFSRSSTEHCNLQYTVMKPYQTFIPLNSTLMHYRHVVRLTVYYYLKEWSLFVFYIVLSVLGVLKLY